MKIRLHWKLMLATTVPVIAVTVGIIWLAFDQLAADYFMILMDKYMVSPTETHRAFLDSVHRYLLWASLVALGLAFFLSYILTRWVLRPLIQVSNASRQIASGNYSARVDSTRSDEVGELGSAFNGMADSLDRLERLRKTMVADVAHELRTPLTNLRGYIEGLTDGVIAPAPETLRMLQKEILRLVNLVESLSKLAKADAAKAYLDRCPVDLKECLTEILALYKMNFDEKDISVTTRLDDQVIVQADRDKLLLAIRNLIENCWKYTPPGGQVDISCQLSNGEAHADFINSGPGIPEKDLPFIFERFFRSDPSRSRDVGGAGIGLAITKQLIEAHGGKIDAASSGGTTHIRFKLPL